MEAPDELAVASGRWERGMADIADTIVAELNRLGIADAQLVGCQVAIRLCQERGGSYWYIPRGEGLARALRDMAIWHEHDGTVTGTNGIEVLAKRHGLTEISVWRILARQRALHVQKVQGELFSREVSH